MKSHIKVRPRNPKKSTNKRTKLVSTLRIEPTSTPKHFAALSDATNLFFFSYSLRTRSLISFSANAGEVLGVVESEIIREGNLFLRHVYPRDRFHILSNLESSLEGLTPYEATYRWIRPDTKKMQWLHCRAHLKEGSEPPIFEGVILDISSTMLLQVTDGFSISPDALLSTLHQGLLLFDSDLRLLYQNGVLDKYPCRFSDPLFRHSEIKIGATLQSAFSTTTYWESFKTILTTATDESIGEQQFDFVQSEGTYRLVVGSVVNDDDSIIILLKIFDVTASSQLETEIKNLSQIATYHAIAGGVIHNLNNALQAIINETAVLLSNASSPSLVSNSAKKIQSISSHTADLTHELIQITSGVTSEVDLNLLTITALNAQKSLYPKMKLHVSFGILEPINGIHSQILGAISDTLHYLLHDQPVSTLSVKTFLRSNSDSFDAVLELCVSGEDNYPIDDSKPHDSKPLGSKLLDSALLVAVEKAGLRWTEAQSNESSRTITLRIETLAPAVVRPESDGAAVIMIIDDDEMVGETFASLLKNQGLSAKAFVTSEEALQSLEKFHTVCEIVIVDAVMPGRDGPSVLRLIRERYPEISIIGVTGSPSKLKDLRDAGADEVMMKPLNAQSLGVCVAKHLKSKGKALPAASNH